MMMPLMLVTVLNMTMSLMMMMMTVVMYGKGGREGGTKEGGAIINMINLLCRDMQTVDTVSHNGYLPDE